MPRRDKRVKKRGAAAEFAKIGPAAATLADAEGLDAHALSVRLRLDAAPDGGDGRP